MKRYLVFAIGLLISTTARAESLPAPDGVYLSRSEFCQSFKKGELELIDIEITNSGKTVGFSDSLCQVATSKKIRENRFALELDCMSYGDVSQLNAIVDVGDKLILWDGRPHQLCELEGSNDSTHAKDRGIVVPADKPISITKTSQVELKSLFDRWGIAVQNCIGGDFADPKVLKACDDRIKSVKLLQDLGYCYGTENQSRAERDWHKCKGDSLREE